MTKSKSSAVADSFAKKRTFSADARARMQEKAKQRGILRAEVVATKVRQAMKDIVAEMTGQDDGDLRDGRLVTEALLYKRAGVHWTTLSKNTDTYGALLAEVKEWKAGLNETRPSRENERRTLAERLNDAKDLYDRLLKSFQFVELELQQAEAERDRALKKLEAAEAVLEKERQNNMHLQERFRLVEASNVLQFPAPQN
jgi:hypothetical protein